MLRSLNILNEHICQPAYSAAYPAATLPLNLKPNLYEHLNDRKLHPQMQIYGNNFGQLNVSTNYPVLIFHEQEAY